MVRYSLTLIAALGVFAGACAPSAPEPPAQAAKKSTKAKKPGAKGEKAEKGEKGQKPAEPAGPVIVYTFQVPDIAGDGSALRQKIEEAAKAAGAEIKADEVKDKGCQYVTFYNVKDGLKPAPSARLRERSATCDKETLDGWDLLVRYRSDSAIAEAPPGKELGNSREEIVRAWETGKNGFGKDTYGWRYVTGRKEGIVTSGVPGVEKDEKVDASTAVTRRLPEALRPESATPQGKGVEAHRWSLGLVKVGARFVEVAGERWTCAGGKDVIAAEITLRVPKADEEAGQKLATEMGKLLEHDKNGKLSDDRVGVCK